MAELVPKIAEHMELLNRISLKRTLTYGVCQNNEYFIGPNKEVSYTSLVRMNILVLITYVHVF